MSLRPLDCFAIHLNNFRVIPRLVICWLLALTWRMANWAMHLDHVDMNAVAMVGLFTGLFVASFKFYIDTGDIQLTHDGQPPKA